MLFSSNTGGTGSSLAKAAIIVAGVASLMASLISLLYVLPFPVRLLRPQVTDMYQIYQVHLATDVSSSNILPCLLLTRLLKEL